MPESQTQPERFDFGFYVFARPEDRTDIEVKHRIWGHLMQSALENFVGSWSPEAVFALASILYALEDSPVSGTGAADMLAALRAEIDKIQPATIDATPTATPEAPPPVALRPRIVPRAPEIAGAE